MQYTKITYLLKIKPPYFIGSQIRGALGHTLKKIVCINPAFECKECFAKESCLYYEFYESKEYHKFRLDFELGKEFYDFSFYLFDNTCNKLPYIVSAFDKVFAEIGLGKDRLTAKYDLFINDIHSNKNGKIVLPKDYIKKFVIDEICQDIVLEFVTPLRIKKDNRFLRDDSIKLSDIINSIYQRQMKLLGKEFKKFPYNIEGEIVKKDLYYKELTRKSNRQKTVMKLGGIMGEVSIKNLNKESFEVLKLGELIGVGKQSVFGLGKIKIKDKICN